MKVLATADGAETPAGRAALALAAALARAGCDAPVLAASKRTDAATTGRGARVIALARADIHPDHWHKSLSGTAGQRFEELLAAERPDVVHVHAWRGLTRHLVAIAARARIPAVITLHDPWIGCLVGDRVRRDESTPSATRCAEPLGPMPCLGCAAHAPPRTAWVPLESAFLLLAERRRDLARELQLARAVRAATPALADETRRALGEDLAGIELDVLGCEGHGALAPHIDLYAQVVAAGPPPAPPPPDWWVARMQAEAERAWDAACARVSGE